MQQNIESILDAAEQQQASDVFLQEDEIPRLKINEQIIVLGDEPLSLAHITALWQFCERVAECASSGAGCHFRWRDPGLRDGTDGPPGFGDWTSRCFDPAFGEGCRHDGALFESFSGGKREAWCEPSGKPAFWRPVPEAGSIC